MLQALTDHPFEPLEDTDLKILSYKTVLLLALATAKRVSYIHALSVHMSCMRFSPDSHAVFLRPNPAFIPKVVGACSHVNLVAFQPPPHTSLEQQRLHKLCPVRALRAYVERTRSFRQVDQLFVFWANSHKGKPVSKQRLSHWIVEAISMAFKFLESFEPIRPGAWLPHGPALKECQSRTYVLLLVLLLLVLSLDVCKVLQTGCDVTGFVSCCPQRWLF